MAATMDDTRLDSRPRPDGVDRLRQAGEPVAAQDAHIVDAAGLQLTQDGEPLAGALAGVLADPQPQDVLGPVQVDADRDIDRPVDDLAVSDLDP
ncbi:hypothetical protein GCM10029978_065610 [Actinoallomurus acanthiterrae]